MAFLSKVVPAVCCGCVLLLSGCGSGSGGIVSVYNSSRSQPKGRNKVATNKGPTNKKGRLNIENSSSVVEQAKPVQEKAKPVQHVQKPALVTKEQEWTGLAPTENNRKPGYQNETGAVTLEYTAYPVHAVGDLVDFRRDGQKITGKETKADLLNGIVKEVIQSWCRKTETLAKPEPVKYKVCCGGEDYWEIFSAEYLINRTHPVDQKPMTVAQAQYHWKPTDGSNPPVGKIGRK